MLFSSEGKAVRFNENDVRSMGRTSRGVRGIRLAEGYEVISMVLPAEDGKVLTVSENGYGKRTKVDEYATKGRAGKGMIAMQTSDRNGKVVGAVQVFDGDEIMLISDQGTLVRTRVDEVSLSGRNTQGVRVIKVKDGEHLMGVERIESIQDDEIVDASESDVDSEASLDVSADTNIETNPEKEND
jgi:DNA gyrase subunit A